jgi:hypothetical protein
MFMVPVAQLIIGWGDFKHVMKHINMFRSNFLYGILYYIFSSILYERT